MPVADFLNAANGGRDGGHGHAEIFDQGHQAVKGLDPAHGRHQTVPDFGQGGPFAAGSVVQLISRAPRRVHTAVYPALVRFHRGPVAVDLQQNLALDGFRGISTSSFSAMISMETRSRTSQVQMGMPEVSISSTASPAASRDGKSILAKSEYSGCGSIFSVASRITPKVPSAPVNMWVKSNPVDLLGAMVPVSMTDPSAMATVRPRTKSLVVPYLTARMPLALVDIMPPMVATGGATRIGWEKVSRRQSLVQDRADHARFHAHEPVFQIDFQDAVHFDHIQQNGPPKGDWAAPVTEVPAPRGTSGILYSARHLDDHDRLSSVGREHDHIRRTLMNGHVPGVGQAVHLTDGYVFRPDNIP